MFEVLRRGAANAVDHNFDVRVVDPDSHQQHGQTPAQRAPHPLEAIAVTGFTEVLQGDGVHNGDSGGAEELPHDDDQQDDQKDGLHLVLIVDDLGMLGCGCSRRGSSGGGQSGVWSKLGGVSLLENCCSGAGVSASFVPVKHAEVKVQVRKLR